MAITWVLLTAMATILSSIQAHPHDRWPEADCCKYDVIFYVDIAAMNQNQSDELKDTLRTVSKYIEMGHMRGTRLGLVTVPISGEQIKLTENKTGFEQQLEGLSFIRPSPGPRDVAKAIKKVSNMFLFRPHNTKVAIGILNGISSNTEETAFEAHNARKQTIFMGVIGMGSSIHADFNRELEEIASPPEFEYSHRSDNYTLLVSGIQESYLGILLKAGLCCNCHWLNYIHYYADPSDPNAYIRCRRRQNHVKQYCPLGLFWDQKRSSCAYPFEINVKDDPCKWNDWDSYHDNLQRNCAVYWICSAINESLADLKSRTTIYIACCTNETRYDIAGHHANLNCSDDIPCLDTCPPEYPAGPVLPTLYPPPTPRGVCTIPYSHSNTTTTHGETRRRRETIMTPTCGGVGPCTPEVLIDFTNGVTGKLGTYVENHGVKVMSYNVPNGAYIKDGGITRVGYFDGRSFLVIPKFAFGWYGKHIEYHIKYRPDPKKRDEMSEGHEEILVTNGDCGIDDTLRATYFPMTNMTEAVMRTEHTNGRVTTNATFESGNWLLMTVRLDLSSTLLIESRDGINLDEIHNDTDRIYGNILQNKPALHIGGYSARSLPHFENFTGYVDEFWLYLCDNV